MQKLFENVIGLLAFFALWDFPLTRKEIEDFLGENVGLEFLKDHFSYFEEKNEYYFSLKESTEILGIRRKEGIDLSMKLIERAQRYLRILRHFPFLRGAALSNTPAMNIATSDSDIDIFLVVKKGRMWTARFWSTFFFSLFGLRATKRETKGKFCLSFLVDEEYSDLEPLKKKKDIYLAFWITTLRPFWGRKFFERLEKQNKDWIRTEVGIQCDLSGRFLWPEKYERRDFWQKIFEFLLPPLTESLFRKLLLRKAKKFTDPNSPNYNPDMVYSDTIQKLHNPDRREEIQRRWEEEIVKNEVSEKNCNTEQFHNDQ